MRLHFQERPWDLYLAVGYSVVMTAILLAINVGNPAAVLLVLFAPGYVLVAALFPGSISSKNRAETDWIERIALSFSLSLAVVPLLALFLDFTMWGIRFAPIVTTIALFTVGVGYAAYWRRMQMPAESRLSASIELAMPSWRDYSFVEKSLTVALGASIVVATITVVYVIIAPRPGDTFTQLYLLGPGGNASGYPKALNVSQSGSVILGIANHESASMNYAVHIDLVGVRIVYNATSGFNETVDINRTNWSTFNVTLADGQNWTQPYTFWINYTGLWKVQVLLFKDGDLSNSYRELHLYVRVS